MKTIFECIARKRAAASVRTISVLDSKDSRTSGSALRIAATEKAMTSSDVSAPSMKDSGCPRSSGEQCIGFLLPLSDDKLLAELRLELRAEFFPVFVGAQGTFLRGRLKTLRA
jgi:hypothetical protein